MRLVLVALLVCTCCSATLAAAAVTRIVPRSGTWNGRVLSGAVGSGPSGRITITGFSFTVSPTHARVLRMIFDYTYSGTTKPGKTCSGDGGASEAHAKRIKGRSFSAPGQVFWTGGGSAALNGAFTSTKRAHGTARFQVEIAGDGCKLPGSVSTRTVSWKASGS